MKTAKSSILPLLSIILLSWIIPDSASSFNPSVSFANSGVSNIRYDINGNKQEVLVERNWSIPLTYRNIGIGIGNVPTVHGLRINYRDLYLDQVNGIHITIREPVEDPHGAIRGLALGLPLTGGGTLTGVTLAFGGVVSSSHITGIQIAGVGMGTGGAIRGIQVAGVGMGTAGPISGFQFAGLGMGSGGNISGVQIAGLGM